MDDLKKRKITLITTSILLAIVVVIGVSYAYFSSKATSATQTVKGGTLTYVLTEGDTLNAENLMPILDDDATSEGASISFSVQNTGTFTSYASIGLTDITISDNLKSADFKWMLYDTDENTKIASGDFSGVSSDITLISNIEFAVNKVRNYKIYIWISETGEDQSDLMNGTFTSKIVINGTQDKVKLLSEVIIEKNPISTATPDFNVSPTTDEGLIQGVDADGETYYFRGAVEDNYVKIDGLKWPSDSVVYDHNKLGSFQDYEALEGECAISYEGYGYASTDECLADIEEVGYKAGEDILWRIVRINGDDTIRLITEGHIGLSYSTDDFTIDENAGYENTLMKSIVEEWYDNNMTNYDKFIATTRYCNDTSTSTTINNYYGFADRDGNPSFICPDTDKSYGGEFNLKIGYLSADEAHFAGQLYVNVSYGYLKNGAYSLTMTPDMIYSTACVTCKGMLTFNNGLDVESAYAERPTIRPVINLKANTLYTEGDGSKTTPYIIK